MLKMRHILYDCTSCKLYFITKRDLISNSFTYFKFGDLMLLQLLYITQLTRVTIISSKQAAQHGGISELT